MVRRLHDWGCMVRFFCKAEAMWVVIASGKQRVGFLDGYGASPKVWLCMGRVWVTGCLSCLVTCMSHLRWLIIGTERVLAWSVPSWSKEEGPLLKTPPFLLSARISPLKKSKALSFSFGPKSSFSRVSFLPFKDQTPHPFSNHAWPFFLCLCPEVFSKNQKKPHAFRVFLQGIKWLLKWGPILYFLQAEFPKSKVTMG